jgi:hypothetical protein
VALAPIYSALHGDLLIPTACASSTRLDHSYRCRGRFLVYHVNAGGGSSFASPIRRWVPGSTQGYSAWDSVSPGRVRRSEPTELLVDVIALPHFCQSPWPALCRLLSPVSYSHDVRPSPLVVLRLVDRKTVLWCAIGGWLRRVAAAFAGAPRLCVGRREGEPCEPLDPGWRVEIRWATTVRLWRAWIAGSWADGHDRILSV